MRLDVDPASGEGFLTGDAVNTAARLQSAAPPMASWSARSPTRSPRGSSTTRSRRPVTLRARPRAGAAWMAKAPTRARGVDRDAAHAARRPRERAGLLKALFDEGRRHVGSRRSPWSSASPASARAAWWPSSPPTSTSVPGDHLAPGPLPALRRRASRSGRWVRSSRLTPVSCETDDPGAVEAKLDTSCPTGPDREWLRQPPACPARPRGAAGLPRGELRRLAALPRGARCAGTGGTRLRGPALGRRGAARLPRAPRPDPRPCRCWSSAPHALSSSSATRPSPPPHPREPHRPGAPHARRDGAAGRRPARRRPRAAEIAGDIVERAEGNPFYAEESARLRRRDLVRQARPPTPPCRCRTRCRR